MSKNEEEATGTMDTGLTLSPKSDKTGDTALEELTMHSKTGIPEESLDKRTHRRAQIKTKLSAIKKLTETLIAKKKDILSPVNTKGTYKPFEWNKILENPLIYSD